MKKTTYLLAFSILLACKNVPSDGVDKSYTKEMTQKDEVESIDSSTQTIQTKEYPKGIFEGVWAENEDENALFEIIGDTLRYVEFYETPYLIDVSGNILEIDLKGYKAKLKILEVNSDSLIYENKGTIKRLYKRLE